MRSVCSRASASVACAVCGKVAVGLHPSGVHLENHRLGGRTDGQGLFQLLSAGVGHHSQLRSEPGDVLLLLFDIRHGNEQREVGVLVPGLLEHVVQRALHPFPDPVSPGTDHHAPSDRGIVRQLGPENHLVVPGREVLGLRGKLSIVTHVSSRCCSSVRSARLRGRSRRTLQREIPPGRMKRRRADTAQVGRNGSSKACPSNHATMAPATSAATAAMPMNRCSRIPRRRMALSITSLRDSRALTSPAPATPALPFSPPRSPCPAPWPSPGPAPPGPG